MAITLNVNGQPRTVDVEPDTPLLWVLRDTLGLTGTKFGCGIAACGACTVHVDGRAIRTCTVPVSAVEGMAVTTIEGLAADGRLHAVQQAWVDHQVPQCGYCQSGMIMAVSALLAQRPDPSDEHIDAAVTNICRCGTFVRVRRAIHAVAKGGALAAEGGAADTGEAVARGHDSVGGGALAAGDGAADTGEAVARGHDSVGSDAVTAGETAAPAHAAATSDAPAPRDAATGAGGNGPAPRGAVASGHGKEARHG